MTYRIALGTDTGSLEDPDQLVLVTLPWSASDLDNDDLIDVISAGGDEVHIQPLVGAQDAIEFLKRILLAEGLDVEQCNRIIAAMNFHLDSHS